MKRSKLITLLAVVAACVLNLLVFFGSSDSYAGMWCMTVCVDGGVTYEACEYFNLNNCLPCGVPNGCPATGGGGDEGEFPRP